MISMFLKITPYPKRTGTFSRKSGRFFANKKTKQFEYDVAHMVAEKYPEMIFEKSDALDLHVIFYLQKPKSVTRLLPTVKPDLSNLIKSFEDALEKCLFDGDQQIVNINAQKRYVENDDKVGIYMLLSKYEG